MSTEFDPVFPDITHPKKHAFLAAYAHCGQIRRAARAAQCDWKNHYLWLAKDPMYAACFAQAQQMAGDFLEEEAIRRAVDGVQKGVWHQGALVGKERVYSDTLLIFALKGAKPAKYKESRTQVNVQVNQSETLQLLFMQLEREEAEEQRRLPPWQPPGGPPPAPQLPLPLPLDTEPPWDVEDHDDEDP
jgi:hypothetical protein